MGSRDLGIAPCNLLNRVLDRDEFSPNMLWRVKKPSSKKLGHCWRKAKDEHSMSSIFTKQTT